MPVAVVRARAALAACPLPPAIARALAVARVAHAVPRADFSRRSYGRIDAGGWGQEVVGASRADPRAAVSALKPRRALALPTHAHASARANLASAVGGTPLAHRTRQELACRAAAAALAVAGAVDARARARAVARAALLVAARPRPPRDAFAVLGLAGDALRDGGLGVGPRSELGVKRLGELIVDALALGGAELSSRGVSGARGLRAIHAAPAGDAAAHTVSRARALAAAAARAEARAAVLARPARGAVAALGDALGSVEAGAAVTARLLAPLPRPSIFAQAGSLGCVAGAMA